MWLVNVVLIITFIFFLVKILKNINKQNKIVVTFLITLSIIFEVIFIAFNIANKSLPTIVQIMVLIFSYVIPIFTVIFNDTDVYFRLKILYAVSCVSYTLRKYEFAEGLLKEAIKKDKNNSKLYYLRAKALEKLSDYSGTRDMLFNVIEIDKTNKEAYLKLVQILDMENKKDTALVILSQFLKMYPEDIEANELLGIIFSELGREKEAERIYESLSEKNDGTYNTYYNLAIIYSKQGEMSKAINAYKIAIEKNSKLYEAHYALGKLYYVSEKFEDSVKELKLALKDETLKARAYFALSQAYIKMDDLEKGVYNLEEAIKLDNNYLKMAKENKLFDKISLEIKRLEDENQEFITYTYDENQEVLEKAE